MKANEDFIFPQIVFTQLHEFDSSVVQELVASYDYLRLLWTLAVAFRLEFAVEVAELGLKAALVVAAILALAFARCCWV
jgi:hypothetical protein